MSVFASHKRKDLAAAQASATKATTGAATPRPDRAGAGMTVIRQTPSPLHLAFGTVYRTGLKWYDCSVFVEGRLLACKVLQHQTSLGFGVSDGSMPIEGSMVLVAVPGSFAGKGWVLGVVPWGRDSIKQGDDTMRLGYSYPTLDYDPYKDNAVYNIPYTDKAFKAAVPSNSHRPADVFPGEYVMMNENHCGMITTMYDTSLTAGASFVRVGRIDDEIRIRSTNFTKWTDAMAVKEFNDGGFISTEGREYVYQNERLGTESGYKKPSSIGDSKEPRPRIRFWKGFLGNLVSWFCIRPRSKKDAGEYDTGLASVHVSQAGNIMVRAAGGVSLERYDRIPVPARQKEEWDPKGDKEKDVEHKGLEPFDLGDDPHAVGLLKASKMAWEQKSMYQRFDELEKDFKVQEETETKAPGNDDDDHCKSKELKLSEYAGRKAGVFVGDDGSVIIRDAWGSEIVMAGGNICINTPGNVITTAHNNVISIAGNSVVERGRKAAELSSDEGDTRIHAQKLVAIAGGSDDSKTGGILLQSLSKDADADPSLKAGDDQKETGEKAVINGIVLKSNSGLGISAPAVYAHGEDVVAVSTGKDGDIVTSSKTLMQYAEDLSLTVCGNSSVGLIKEAVLVQGDGAFVFGNNAALINGKNVAITVPVNADGSPTDFTDIKDLPEKSTTYNVKDVDKHAKFTFRSSEQAGTDAGIEPWKPNKKFTMYQPYWQISRNNKNPLLSKDTKDLAPKKLKPEEVNGTKCWPGKDAMNDGKFVTLKTSNVDKEDLSKKRDALKDSVELDKKKFSTFEI